MSGPQIAGLVALAILIIYVVARMRGYTLGGRENFASKKAHEISQKAGELFKGGADGVRYSDYRAAGIPDADPVQFSDVRDLAKKGALTPENVQQIV